MVSLHGQSIKRTNSDLRLENTRSSGLNSRYINISYIYIYVYIIYISIVPYIYRYSICISNDKVNMFSGFTIASHEIFQKA